MYNIKFLLTIGGKSCTVSKEDLIIYQQCFLYISALLFASVTIAIAYTDNCPDCLGDDLIRAIDYLNGKRSCWHQSQHHFLLKFKLACLNGIYDVIGDLYKNSYNASRQECRKIFTEPCVTLAKDEDSQSECIMTNMRAMVGAYSDMERCNRRPLDRSDAYILLKVIQGTTTGWRIVHPQC